MHACSGFMYACIYGCTLFLLACADLNAWLQESSISHWAGAEIIDELLFLRVP